MAGKLVILAKLLVVTCYILAGLNKFQGIEKTKGMTVDSIKKFDQFLHKDHGLMELPFKDLMIQHADALVYGVAIFEIVGGLLVLAGSKLAAFGLFLLTGAFTFMVHNPFYKGQNADMRLLQWKLGVPNLVIMTIFIMLMGWNGKAMAAGEFLTVKHLKLRK